MAERSDIQKLKAYFRELSPAGRSMLETALTGAVAAELAPFRDLVLEALGQARDDLGESAPPPVAAAPEASAPEPAAERPDPWDLILQVFDPFLIDEIPRRKTTGVIPRASRERLLIWLRTTGAPELEAEAVEALAQADTPEKTAKALHSLRTKLAGKLEEQLSGLDTGRGRARLAGALGGEDKLEDLRDLQVLCQRQAVFDTLAGDLAQLGALPGDEAVRAIHDRLSKIAQRTPDVLSFALVLARRAMSGPQIFLRIGTFAADATDGQRVADRPFGRVIDIAISEADRAVQRAAAKQATADAAEFLAAVKTFGSTVRALCTEIDFAPDGPQARRIGELRTEMGEIIRRRLQDVPARMRSLVRPRKDEKKEPAASEMERLEIDLKLLMTTRSFAEEIALNALAGRAHSEARDLLDTGTPILIERLRTERAESRAALLARLEIIIRMSRVIFGHDFAATLSRSIDVARQQAEGRKARSA